jgi:hypothetical protein
MNDKIILEQAQKICRNLLDIDPPETVEKIKEIISKVSQLLSLNTGDQELLLSRLLEVTGVNQDAPRILDNEKVVPWVVEKWSRMPDNRRFWRRYQNYLADEKKIAPKVISRLDELTNNILDRLADPNDHDEFDKRGLVVGHVQSGKTSNYIGLIAKAADAGYKLIIVLAGIHSSLRSQTQLRIDEGFLGYDTETTRSFSQSNNRIGVGRFDPNVPAHSLTSSALNGDFRKNIKETVSISLKGSDPVVVVIKKNSTVLKHLIEWLSRQAGDDVPGTNNRIINNLPMLLIDDEADNASINISKSSVSSINGSIRALLCLFKKSAYVGYTATPYANVFIALPKSGEEPGKGLSIVTGNKDYPVGEDLFPRDFIINIPPPSNYIGPEKFFGIVSEDVMYENIAEDEDEQLQNQTFSIQLYKPVLDHQPYDYQSNITSEMLRKENYNFIPDGHKIGDKKPEELPGSLKEAIKCFILSCAARRVRGQVNVHNSMLIHVTRFIEWQNHIALLVEEDLSRYKNKIEFRNQEFLDDMKDLWENEFVRKTEEIQNLPELNDSAITTITWDQLEPELLAAVTKIRVRAVHGSKLLGGLESENIQPLDYYNNQKGGLSVIAVGGNKLSRGLTLEGLTISYYLRASKMYDTLMQMGRWFGYRPGYLDLCRLYTTNDLVSHYKHITAATEEMRAEFDRMSLLNRPPSKYGLKVRAHSGVLTITAANKFRYKKMMSFIFSGDLEETWKFDKSRVDLFEKNYLFTARFIDSLGKTHGPANNSKYLKSQEFVWRGQDNYRDVINYLNDYQSTQTSFNTGLLREYIEKQAAVGNLVNWTIALVDKVSEEDTKFEIGRHKVGLSYRRDDSKKGQFYELSRAHIIGNYHEYIDLSDNQLEEAFEKTVEDKRQNGIETPTNHPSPLRIRRSRSEQNALLLIYPLDPKPKSEEPPYSSVPIIGLAISFPEIDNELNVSYAVNDVFQKELDYPDDLDVDDIEADEENDERNLMNGQSSPLGDKVFLDLIENSYQNVLQETEFSSGLVPVYPKTENIDNEIKSASNLVLDVDKAIGYDTLPFYSEKDIQQFYLNASPKVVVNPDKEFVAYKGDIIGPKRSRYVTFSLNDHPAVFADNCWVIRSNIANSKYMCVLLNSTLFGAWVRVKGEQLKDTYFIKNEVLYKFPLVWPEEDKLWLYDNLFDLLTAIGRQEQLSGKGSGRSFFAGILDALIFSTYFSDTMSKERETLYRELINLVPKDLPTDNKIAVLAEELFIVLHDKNHPVRKTLYFLDSKEKVKRIKSVFTR